MKLRLSLLEEPKTEIFGVDDVSMALSKTADAALPTMLNENQSAM